MERSCYRCGAQVEEHTTFCSACGAPQIRVTSPLTPAMPPGTPDSIQPPSFPVQLIPTGQIQWRKFWRIVWPVALISGAALFFLGPFGILVFLVDVILAINRYHGQHPGPLPASHGARLGAFTGLLSFFVLLIFVTVSVLRDTGEARREILLAIQQKTAANPDPRAQQVAQFLATDQGLMLFAIFTALFLLATCLVLAGAVGALTVALSRKRQRRSGSGS